MATIVHTRESAAKIRVALVIESGRIRPVWFEETDRPGRDRVRIREVSSTWTHREGAVRIINFAVWDGARCYRLALNTGDFTWTLGIAEESPFPDGGGTSGGRQMRPAGSRRS